jgi:hypothetical protein
MSDAHLIASWGARNRDLARNRVRSAVRNRGRVEGYHRQLADGVKLFRHRHMLIFASDARRLVTGDRVGNPLGNRGQVAPISGSGETNGSVRGSDL